MLKSFVLAALLLQSDFDPRPLDGPVERHALLSGSYSILVTIRAVRSDGKPARRATIACSGYWRKHVDEATTQLIWKYPFPADSNGSATFNPDWSPGEQMRCVATENGRQGRVTVNLDEADRQRKEIVLR